MAPRQVRPRGRQLTAQQRDNQLRKRAFLEEIGGHVDQFYDTILDKAMQLGGATKEGIQGAVQELTQGSRLPRWMMAAGYLPHVVDYVARKAGGQPQQGQAAGQAAGAAASAAGAAANAVGQLASQVQQATRGEEVAAQQSLPAQAPPQAQQSQAPQSRPQAPRADEYEAGMSMPVGASRRYRRRVQGRRPVSKLQRLAQFWDEQPEGQAADVTLDDLMTPQATQAIKGALAAYPGGVDEQALETALGLLLTSRRIPAGFQRFGTQVVFQWLKRHGMLDAKGAGLTPEGVIQKYATLRR